MFLSLAFLVVLLYKVFSEEPVEHLLIEKEDIESESSLPCRREEKGDECAHFAVGVGCENGHQVALENKTTSVALMVTEGASVCHLG